MGDILTREEVAQLRAQIARLTEELGRQRETRESDLEVFRSTVRKLAKERDMARAKVGEVSRDNDRLRSVLFAYRADNYRLRELLEEARNMIVTNWLVLGEYQRPREVSRLMTRIRTELTGSPEPPGLSEAPPVSAMRWVADTVERGDSELDCSLEEVNAVIRWLRAWAEQTEGRS